MDPIFLTFKHPALEHAYDRHAASGGGLNGDAAVLRVLFAVTLFGIGRYLRLGLPSAYGGAAILITVYAWATMMWKRRCGSETLVAVRSKITMLSRLAGVIFQYCGSIFDDKMTTNLFGFMLRSGILSSFIFSFHMKLKFKYHLPCHIASTMAVLFLVSKTTCFNVLSVNEHHVIIPIAQFLDLAAKRIMAASGFELNVPPMMHPCLHLSVWFLTGFVLVGGSFVLWMKERNSRITYMEQGFSKRFEVKHGKKMLKLTQKMPCWFIFTHLGVLTIYFAVTWIWTYLIVNLIDSVGAVIV